MNTYTNPTQGIFGDTSRVGSAIGQFSAEVKAFVAAILSPNRIIGQVEQMRKLQRQAAALDASNPAQAALLRRKAARIGL